MGTINETSMRSIPLTLQQQDIYYEQLLYPDVPIYNIGAKISIEGNLHQDAIRSAYKHLIDQHDAFRSIITTDSNGPAFCILPDHGTSLGFIDFSWSDQAEELANDYMEKEFVKPFDISQRKVLHKFCLVKVRESFHYLFSVYHHLITDGWGTSLMFQRLTSNYNELVVHGNIQSTYPFYYTHYADDDQRYQTSENYQHDKTYWTTRFSPLPGSLIPAMTLSRRPESRRQVLMVNRTLYNALGTLATRCGASTFHVILAALYTYLGRFYDNYDFAIGLPVLNRGTSAFKKTVGIFMGITPLRIQFDAEDTFEELVNRIKTQLRQDYRHQRFPLGKLVQQLNIAHEKEKLSNISLSYEKHNYADTFKDTQTRVIPLTHGAERVALAVYIREFDQEADVKIDFDYNLSYFDEVTIKRLTHHFETLIGEVVHHSAWKIKDLCFMLPEEKENLLFNFNNTSSDYPDEETIPSLIEYQTRISPKKIALRDNQTAYTYEELKTKTDKIAGYLNELEREHNRPVAVLLDRSVDMVVILLAILKSGRCYIPLDPSFPLARLSYILDNSKAGILIHRGDQCELSREGIWMINVNTVLKQDHQLTTNRDIDVSANSIAYIIYTSGSTGAPKGVRIRHRSVVNFLTSMQGAPGICSNDVMFAVTTYSFDISVLELFLPLISGATTFIVDAHTLSSPSAIVDRMNTIKPDIIQATPGFYQMLLHSGWQGDKQLKILCGGDSLNESLAEKLLQTCSEVWNMYGPTETTIWSSVKRIRRPDDAKNIGKPINNTIFYILDTWLNPVPVGATGDIYIGGDGLAKDYHRNRRLTKERFIDSPFHSHKRIYKTGDVGKWNDSGEVLFLGRKDLQVKVRGYRIELGEIEKALEALPNIDAAVVVARKGSDQDSFLVAFVKTPDPEFAPHDVAVALKESLPNYMIPNRIVSVSDFPLTPNKKIDRQALVQRDISEFAGDPSKEELPRDHIETSLAKLWTNALNLTVTNVYSNFFSLGGHSIKAAQLAKDISSYFQVRFGIKDVFDNPTISQQSKIIAAMEKSCFEPISLAPESDLHPVSAVQEGLWLACQRHNVSVAYNMYAAFEVEGAISISVLERSFQLLITTHEILRTNFMERRGIPMQKVQPKENLIFRLQEIRADSWKEAGEIILQIIRTGFDLERDLLLKVYAITLPESSVLAFVTHHLIMDGRSLEIFISELKDQYNAIVSNSASVIAQPVIQYKDYAVWSHQQPSETIRRSRKEYWTEQFTGLQTAAIFKRDRHIQTFKGNKLSFVFDANINHSFRNLANECETSMFNTVTASINALIYHVTGRERFCLGIPMAGRTHPDLRNLIGMFVNTIVVSNHVEAEDTFKMLCVKATASFKQSMQYQDYPFSQFLKTLSLPDMPVDVMVAYQHTDIDTMHGIDFNGFSLKGYSVVHGSSRFPITFNFLDAPDGLSCELEYDTGLYDQQTILLIMENYQRLLRQITKDADAAIESLKIECVMEKERKADISIDFHF
jgi:amino acid adenylation domain-containing protein